MIPDTIAEFLLWALAWAVAGCAWCVGCAAWRALGGK